MATHDDVKRALEAALGLSRNTLENPVPIANTILERIGGLDDRINIIEIEVLTTVPKFSGKDKEDVEEWISQVAVLFTASGKQPGVNNANIVQYAIGGLQGAALRWYTEMKQAAVRNLVNWADANNDNDLKHRIKRKFISDE
jgi:hypothetical protein